MKTNKLLSIAAVAAAVGCVAVSILVTKTNPGKTLWHDKLAPKVEMTVQAHEPMVGIFTGEYLDGAPVYRLPPLMVARDRKTELARIEREDALAQAEANRISNAGDPTMPTPPAQVSTARSQPVPFAYVRHVSAQIRNWWSRSRG